MLIQDVILTVGSLLFVAALLPTVFSPSKPALATSLITGTVLAVFAVVYWTLELTFTSVTTAAASLLWLTIATQTIFQRRQ